MLRLRRTFRKVKWWIRVIEIQDMRVHIRMGQTSAYLPRLPKVFLNSEFGMNWNSQVKQKSFTYAENEVFYFTGQHLNDFWGVKQMSFKTLKKHNK